MAGNKKEQHIAKKNDTILQGYIIPTAESKNEHKNADNDSRHSTKSG